MSFPGHSTRTRPYGLKVICRAAENLIKSLIAD